MNIIQLTIKIITAEKPGRIMTLIKTRIYEVMFKARGYIKNKMREISISIISRLMAFLMMSAVFPTIGVTAKDIDYGLASDNLKLNIDSARVIELTNTVSEIKPGESKIQREEREKAEAEAEMKAQEAKIKSELVSKSTKSIRVYADPSNFDEIYMRAQNTYGVDWRILKAVHYVETGCSGSTSKRSYAGAVGPMQFLPSTWRSYGVDGNGDGTADITNVEDAVFAAAKYLSACEYPDVKKALWGYNPSSSYYSKVMKVARSLGF